MIYAKISNYFRYLGYNHKREKRTFGIFDENRAFCAFASRHIDALDQNNGGHFEKLFLYFLANLSSNVISRNFI